MQRIGYYRQSSALGAPGASPDMGMSATGLSGSYSVSGSASASTTATGIVVVVVAVLFGYMLLQHKL